MMGLVYFFIILSSVIVIYYAFTPSKITLKLPSSKKEKEEISRKRRSVFILPPFLKLSKFLIDKFNMRKKLSDKLAGSRSLLTPEEFMSIRLELVMLLGVIVLFLLPKFDPLSLVIFCGLGYFLPEFYLKRKIRLHKEAIVRVLPETIDLIGLCVEAGLDFTSALKWIVKKVPDNPLVQEFAVVLEEIRWGRSSSEALRNMSKRLNIPEVSSFVQTLIQAERMGTPVSETFAMLSEDTRTQRFLKGEKMAMRAPIKILLPLLFCILPVIGIIIGGPILLQFMQGGLFGGIIR